MCGICGIVNKEGGDLGVVRAMNDRLIHRGPDDGAVWLEKNVAFGHRRLSILDLSKNGLQPMASMDGRYEIVFNGEIYNYADLRAQMAIKGYRFKSQTDTEVIMALYDFYGETCVGYMEGMWAFAIYDKQTERMFCSRDRFGKKPFYYFHDDKTFVFASQIKALLAIPGFRKNLNEEALGYYLTFGYIPGDLAIWRGIKKLPHASNLKIDTNQLEKITVETYWRSDEKLGKNIVFSSKEDVEENTRALLLKSVKKRLVADVPVGAFLSGGIDSSGVVAAVSREIGSMENFHTFSIGFDYKRYDETDKSELVARSIGTRHHAKRLGAQEALAITRELSDYYDEPFADSSMIPTYALAKLARQYVTVCLSGDGADELWGGYLNYVMFAYVTFIKKYSPKLLHGLIGRGSDVLSEILHPAHTNVGLAHGFRSLAWIKKDDPELFARLSSFHVPTDDKYYSLFNSYFVKNRTWQDCLMQSYLNTHLVDDFLVKVDRASMAHGLEVRCPYLDKEFAEFALANVPSSEKVYVKNGKYRLKSLLRRAISPWLPEEIIRGGKKGFSLPMSEYLVKEWEPVVKEAVLELADKNILPFTKKEIEITLKKHKRGYADYSQFIYALYNFSLWHEKWNK